MIFKLSFATIWSIWTGVLNNHTTGVTMGQATDKQTLKALREKRKATIASARKSIKANNQIIKSIREQISAEAKTIPQIAHALGMDTAKVLLFVSALKKYGEVVEGPKDGDYFKYGQVLTSDGERQ
jgi:hypothetical protein